MTGSRFALMVQWIQLHSRLGTIKRVDKLGQLRRRLLLFPLRDQLILGHQGNLALGLCLDINVGLLIRGLLDLQQQYLELSEVLVELDQ